MKLLDEKEMSWWAYCQCRDGNDTPEMRKLITYNEFIFYYCKCIKDIEEMWSKISVPWWANNYCRDIKDRSEVRKYYINSYWFKDFQYTIEKH